MLSFLDQLFDSIGHAVWPTDIWPDHGALNIMLIDENTLDILVIDLQDQLNEPQCHSRLAWIVWFR